MPAGTSVLLTPGSLDARLLRAYRRTTYHVPGGIVRIGRRAPAVDRILRQHQVSSAALITAWNPYSRLMPPGWNRRMQRALRQTLRRHTILPAHGHWRGWSEDHLLVLMAPEQATPVARRFCQNAIVSLHLRQPARLVQT